MMDETEKTLTEVTNGKAPSLTILQDAVDRRAKREHNLFLDVPSWDGDLIAEYRVPDPEELKQLAERVMRRARNGDEIKSGTADIDLIVAAHVGLYVINPESGDRVAIEDEFGHVGYNRIAKVLGKEDEIKSNADAVRYLMAERGDKDGTWVENVVAMSMHANSIQRWMRDTSKRASRIEEVLGEL
jgi:hypothetical protein